jgi:hypothetical protein
MSKTFKFLFICTVLALTALSVQAADTSTPAPAAKSSQPSNVQFVALKGTVTETMNSGGYTYVQLDYNGAKYWAAMPTTEVKVGSNVTVSTGMVMHNFTSKSLGRTFDSIVFSQGLVKE